MENEVLAMWFQVSLRKLFLVEWLSNKNIFLGDATLLFDVELINIGDSPPTTNVFKEIDDNKDKQLSRDEVTSIKLISNSI